MTATSVKQSYHNHTRLSDGRCSLQDHIAAAREYGLEQLGISDHYTIHPNEIVGWSMPLDGLEDYVRELTETAATLTDLNLRVGVEADFFPETTSDLRERLADLSFDYVIGSVHYVDGFPVDEHTRFWDALTIPERDDIHRGYWTRIRQMAETGLYDFVGHIDLTKKFGHRPAADLSPEINAALEAVKNANMAIEINTAGWSLPAAEGYPSIGILNAAHVLGIPLLINSDAHQADHLVRDFDKAVDLAKRAGYTELARYQSRQRTNVVL